jgi:23S rRNA (adenine2503-C2)-methyltransferase
VSSETTSVARKEVSEELKIGQRNQAAGQKKNLLDLPVAELPLPSERVEYRRRQLADWLYLKGAREYDRMTNLPTAWRERLAREWKIDPFAAIERFPSRDESVRYLFTLDDGLQTEAVYMPYANRKTVCVSSMVGCPAGCAFCATGALGFGRNLRTGEIVGQLLAVAWLEGFSPREIRNVVLMGMGEALLNYDAALAAIRTMIDPGALDMSPRRITLSTVGLPARIRRLAAEGLPLTLAVSLHAPDEETRRRIIPTAHAHSIEAIMEALAAWQEQIGRRVTIEYTMLEGVNDHAWQARALADLLTELRCHVNLIPFNPWAGSGFESSSRLAVGRFQDALESAGLSVSVRFSRGRDTGGACGQLALNKEGSPGARAAP